MVTKGPFVNSTSKTLNDSPLCRYPAQLECVDSLLILLDWGVSSDIFQIYNLKGEHLASFGIKGRGYGELINPNPFFNVDKTNKTILINDMNKIIEYDLNKIIKGEKQYTNVIDINEKLNINSAQISRIVKLQDRYYYFDGSNGQRLKIFSPQSEYPIEYNSYPQTIQATESSTDNYLVWNYMPRISVSPNQMHIAQTTYIGGVLDILQRAPDAIKHVTTTFIYPPVYNKIDEHNISWTRESTLGFDAISSSDEAIYTLLNGNLGAELQQSSPQHPFTSNITVFDWNGALAKIVKTPHMMMTFTIGNSERTGYATTYHEGGYSLVEINW